MRLTLASDIIAITHTFLRSSQVIFQDAENALVTVTLFQRVVDEYRHKARENKFMVRDFVYNPDELQAGKNELTKLVTDKKKQFGPLVRMMKEMQGWGRYFGNVSKM